MPWRSKGACVYAYVVGAAVLRRRRRRRRLLWLLLRLLFDCHPPRSCCTALHVALVLVRGSVVLMLVLVFGASDCLSGTLVAVASALLHLPVVGR